MSHEHAVTANTVACFRTFIGCVVKGVMDVTGGVGSGTIIVFECGWGLCVNSNGAHWVVPPVDIEPAIQGVLASLDKLIR